MKQKLFALFIFIFLMKENSFAQYKPVEGRKYFSYSDSVFEVGEVKILRNVLFPYDKCMPTNESNRHLDSVLLFLNNHKEITIEVGCNSDLISNNEYNTKLTQCRANSVRDWLLMNGIDSGRVSAKGYGETNPLDHNSTIGGDDYPIGSVINRRTEIKITAILPK